MSKKNENMFALGAILFFVVVGLAFAVPQLTNKRTNQRKCGR